MSASDYVRRAMRPSVTEAECRTDPERGFHLMLAAGRAALAARRANPAKEPRP